MLIEDLERMESKPMIRMKMTKMMLEYLIVMMMKR